jgi:predicted DCC family thiol-disulfide oxidoreductase YuxK
MNTKANKINGKHLILYDGICGLCNKFTQLVLKHDKNDLFRFASLQSKTANEILKNYGYSNNNLDTVYVIENYEKDNQKIYMRAKAIIFVLEQLRLLFSPVNLLKILPDTFLNCAYDMVAKSRYRLFGQSDQCILPKESDSNKFIDI